jgi:hypothetical protein
MSHRKCLLFTFVCCLVAVIAVVPALAQDEPKEWTKTITVSAGDYDRLNSPVSVEFDVPFDWKEEPYVCNLRELGNDNDLETSLLDLGLGFLSLLNVQFTEPCVLDRDPTIEQDGDSYPCMLHFLIPELNKGETRQFELILAKSSVVFIDMERPRRRIYRPRAVEGEYADVYTFSERPVLRYMCEPLNDSTSADRERTYKVFHQVYDFAGENFITKGAGGQYTHHRGIFFGFNKTTYGDNQRVDIWHCSGDTHQAHAGILDESVGNVLGRHVVAIDWNGVGKETFAKEQRELTVYNVPDGRMIDFASVVRTVDGPIQLDGDPQHAGFHFRAAQEVAAGDQKRTYYLRPDGKGGPGETRNWPGQAEHVDLPWNAMSFVVADQRYTALYIDRPENPKEARFSERSYGRFGSYFEYEITEENPLEVNYRLWIQEGEMTVDEAQRLSDDFVHPPTVTVE